MKNKNIIRIAVVTLCILLIPLIAMQFSDEVDWNLFDFVFMGALIFGTGLAYELVARRGRTVAYRAAVGLALAAAFLLIWVNGAVGIIGSEDNPANLLYFGVLAVGFLGSIIARFKARRMVWVLSIAALVQALVPILALIIWSPELTSWGALGVAGVFALNAFFAVLFVGSAILFRQAGDLDARVV